MGVDIFIDSVFSPQLDAIKARWEGEATTLETPETFIRRTTQIYDDLRATGAYFRCAYNESDPLWAVGLSWRGDVWPLIKEGRLSLEAMRGLVDLIEDRPLTRERFARHYLENMADGAHRHPVTQWLQETNRASFEMFEQLPFDFEATFHLVC